MNMDAYPPANQRMANVVRDVYEQWIIIENEWNRRNPGQPVRVAEAWREWARDEMGEVVRFTWQWVLAGVTDVRRAWRARAGEVASMFLEALAVIEADANAMTIDTSRFP